jgi:hemolysin activation/secretion protein
MSVPMGYWTLSNNFSWSNYRTSFVLVNGDRFYSYGNSTTNDISLDRLLFRGQSFKISAGGGFTYKTNSNYSKVLDLKMRNDVSSRDLSIIHFDLPTTLYTKLGVFYFKPSYAQGVRAFDALRDKDHNYSQSAQFNAWKLYAYYTKNLWAVNYTATFDGQYTKDEMYGSEAFFIGGEYTVRGFKEDSFQGDSGYAWRNDLSMNLGKAFKSENPILQAITPRLFLDYGYAHSNHKYIKSEILSGAGAKVGVNYKFFDASISYAEPLKKPDWMSENHVWYFYAGVSFRF